MGFFTEYFSSFFRNSDPNEDEINENITKLMKFPWFKEIFNSPELQKVMMEDKELRQYLGTINVNSLRLYPRKQLATRNKIINEVYKSVHQNK